MYGKEDREKETREGCLFACSNVSGSRIHLCEVNHGMRMKRTRGSIRRCIRQCLAVFVSLTALWLIWLTADSAALLEQLRTLASNEELALTLLQAELGPLENEQLSLLERLVLRQSVLLNVSPPEETLTPPPMDDFRTTDTPNVEPELPDESEQEDLPLTTTAPEGIIGKTMVAGTGAKYITRGNVSIYNHTNYKLDIDALLNAAPQLSGKSDGPQVLIFHSHATEAYTMDGTDIYEESDSYRTLNTEQNMVRVGAEMAAILEAAGIGVIHDTTLYDYPKYNDAYNRSYDGVAAWLEQYPSIRLVIDVHRDALTAADGTLYKTIAGTVDHCAQVMMVMGSDAGGYQHPNWRVNLSLALSIQKALTDKWATLARPLVLRTSRFNQQLSTGQILLEVGTHGNTLQEALTAVRLFSRTLVEMMT